MKQGLEGRLRKLELEYAAALDSQRVISVRWLTANEIKQGRLPGLYELLPEDGDSPVVPIGDARQQTVGVVATDLASKARRMIRLY
jgi:hypothetical protein